VKRGRLAPAERLATAGGALFAACFAAGLVFADVIASPAFYEVWPEGLDSFAQVEDYVAANRSELRALSFFHALAAIALLAFAAALASLSGGPQPSSHLLLARATLAGSGVAATMLLLSATAFWTLTEPTLAGDASLARALLLLAYLTGGPVFVAPLALTIAAASLLGRREQTLPASITRPGLATAAIALLPLATLLGSARSRSLELTVPAVLLAVIWIFATSSTLTLRGESRR
jgi:hypothetical protein